MMNLLNTKTLLVIAALLASILGILITQERRSARAEQQKAEQQRRDKERSDNLRKYQQQEPDPVQSLGLGHDVQSTDQNSSNQKAHAKKNKVILFLLLFATTAFAAPTAPPVDYLTMLENDITNLVTTKGGLLVDVGWIELVLFSGFAMTFFLIRTAASSRRHSIMNVEGLTLLLGGMMFAGIFLTLYTVPLGSTGLSLSQVPTAVSHCISGLITQGMIDPLLQQVRDIATGLQKPGAVAFLDMAVYWMTLGEMAIVTMVLFAVNGFAYFVVGILTLFGPLFIPFLVTTNFTGKFFGWVGSMFQYSMLTPVISAFTYVWAMFFTTFFSKSVHGDYSLDHFLFLTGIMFTMIGSFFFTAFKLPGLSAEMFGGGGNIGAGVMNSYTSFVRTILRARTITGTLQ
jgi:type IV secretion system protein VirB6